LASYKTFGKKSVRSPNQRTDTNMTYKPHFNFISALRALENE